ncbi:[FeFe] hydrogenase H-cluster maturation GTPase HydF [Sutterella sp.]|uniref:[FeFe] hydrogenase H-cluster maturation GTPase HydF n=1 Tax=Sutterella sp. TaxID=1981025 RepID=UPI0026DEFC26|nr:[FeFe] hydrogenase H-cluster maturation GTPase HydF [Sutterella sp.]MDO5530379.1 [FeFe] hydrogenase H-cluster maturation GTPase HydF [Sutterella sp.]
MLDTPKGLRIHIGLFGRRNAGKSSLANALTNQRISIVSAVPGTTTDPVEKACELAPIGPVVFIDTAGVDDVGDLGAARVERSKTVLEWVDLALIVASAAGLEADDRELLDRAKELGTSAVLVLNKADLHAPSEALLAEARSWGIPVVVTDAQNRTGIDELRQAIIRTVSDETEPDRPIAGDLAHAGDAVILVTPIDTGAPKGRLILPQVQAIRELLDAHAKAYVIQQDRVAEAIADLKTPPAFVMTDSQAIDDVARQTPESIPLTTFSLQMAYAKNDLVALAEGTAALSRLKDGDRVLICETCSHHPQKDDIGRLKIPRWLREKTGKNLQIDIAVGKDFPDDLTPYAVLIQCGGCVVTRRHLLMRLRRAKAQGVPMTNYGLAICYLRGYLERVLSCHPDALAAYRAAMAKAE